MTELVAEMVLRGAWTLIEPSQIYSLLILTWPELYRGGTIPWSSVHFLQPSAGQIYGSDVRKSLINLVLDMPCPPLAPALFDIQ